MQIFEMSSIYNNLKALKASKIAIYHWNGWFDIFSRDSFQMFINLDNPQKIAFGPWSHMQIYPDMSGIEFLRWYDYWLKGIDNGIMDEPPIHYFTMRDGVKGEWKPAQSWPLTDTDRIPYYFHGEKSGSVHSINDGMLKDGKPSTGSASDDYTVDFSVTVGKPSRWSNGYADGGKDFTPPAMLPVDEKGLTYTTDVLDADMEVTGHPVVNLWVASTSDDADFFVYLEEIDTTGHSRYITEGILKASHRKTVEPPLR